MDITFYRGYRLESSSVGTDIYFDQTLLEVKVPLDKAKSIIDEWHNAK